MIVLNLERTNKKKKHLPLNNVPKLSTAIVSRSVACSRSVRRVSTRDRPLSEQLFVSPARLCASYSGVPRRIGDIIGHHPGTTGRFFGGTRFNSRWLAVRPVVIAKWAAEHPHRSLRSVLSSWLETPPRPPPGVPQSFAESRESQVERCPIFSSLFCPGSFAREEGGGGHIPP